MEELIRQAFLHVEVIGPHVADGHYDLVGPNGDIILPQVWETVVEPDWTITMHMWPMPEKPKTPDLTDMPLIDDPLLIVEDPPPKGAKGKTGAKKPPSGKHAKGKGPPVPAVPFPMGDDFPLPPDDILIPPPPPGPTKAKPAPAKPRGTPSGLAGWMIGQRPKGKQPLKVEKKPEVVAGHQHAASSSDNAACSIM